VSLGLDWLIHQSNLALRLKNVEGTQLDTDWNGNPRVFQRSCEYLLFDFQVEDAHDQNGSKAHEHKIHPADRHAWSTRQDPSN